MQSLPVFLDVGKVKKLPRGQGAQLAASIASEEVQVHTVQIELLNCPLGPTISVLFSPLGRVWRRKGIDKIDIKILNFPNLVLSLTTTKALH